MMNLSAELDAPATDERPVYIRQVAHALPAGESLLWQGAPDRASVARHVFHSRVLAGYFAAMLLIWALAYDGPYSDATFAVGLAARVVASLVAVGIVQGLALVVARTSVYAITDRRVVLHIGMVLPMSINIPFSRLQSASVATFRDGTGQVALSLTRESAVAYIALWPHCRVFSLNHPTPLLRGLRDPVRVGRLLADAVAGAEPSVVRAAPTSRESADVLVPQPA